MARSLPITYDELPSPSAETTSAGQKQQSKALYRVSCPGLTECVPLAECPELLLEISRQCYRGDFSLSCGVNEYEPHVCCPRVVTSPTFNDQRAPAACGKSIVQGDFYNGLGAYPFVARIGFKSTFFFFIGRPRQHAHAQTTQLARPPRVGSAPSFRLQTVAHLF